MVATEHNVQVGVTRSSRSRPWRRRRTGIRPSRRLRRATPYLFMAPAVIAVVLVQIVPMLAGVVMSFMKLNQFTIGDWTHAPFVGLSNYRIAIGSDNAISRALFTSFLVTFLYSVVIVAGSWVLGMAAAVFLSEEVRGRKVMGSLFLLSYALPTFVAATLWTFMFQPHGAVNVVLGDDLGLIPGDTFWFAGSKAFWAMSVNTLWRTWPFAFLMLLPAVQSIPGELFEAARVDGANRWREFRAITLPSTRSVALLLVLIIGFWTFNDFTTPYLMFSSAAPTSVDVLSLVIYRTSFVNLNFGLGSAMSLLMVAFMVGASMLYLRALRMDVEGLGA